LLESSLGLKKQRKEKNAQSARYQQTRFAVLARDEVTRCTCRVTALPCRNFLRWIYKLKFIPQLANFSGACAHLTQNYGRPAQSFWLCQFLPADFVHELFLQRRLYTSFIESRAGITPRFGCDQTCHALFSVSDNPLKDRKIML